MFQLSYHSKSTTKLHDVDLQNILDTAILNNAANDITGCLIYHNSCFVQILEGNESDLMQLFEKIKEDPRHKEVTLLWENDVDKRTFDNWNMAYYQLNNETEKQFLSNLSLLSTLSEKSSLSLLTFWAAISKIVDGTRLNQLPALPT